MSDNKLNLSKITLGIVILIAVPVGVFTFLSSKPRTPISIVLELKVPDSKNPGLSVISDESLQKLKTLINDNMILNDQNRVIEIFNKEKSDYINLVTIISVLLTVFSLFSILSSFIDKGEFQKLSQEMQSKIAEYEKELKSVHLNSLLAYLRKNRDAFSSDAVNKLDDGTIVSDNATFIMFFTSMISEALNFTDRKKIDDFTNNQDFCVEYINLIKSATSYGILKNFIPYTVLNVNTNELLRVAISTLYNKVGKEKFTEFKKIVTLLSPLEWGSY